jgi:hypothetical protein
MNPAIDGEKVEQRREVAATFLHIDIFYYSRTGTTALAVDHAEEILKSSGHHTRRQRIVPRVSLPYVVWLALSFIPRVRVPIRQLSPMSDTADACLLALPKWTFSCPPINAFLRKYMLQLPPTVVLVTCGGWREHPYVKALARRLSESGVEVLGARAFKRRDINSGLAVEYISSLLTESLGKVYRVNSPSQK